MLLKFDKESLSFAVKEKPTKRASREDGSHEEQQVPHPFGEEMDFPTGESWYSVWVLARKRNVTTWKVVKHHIMQNLTDTVTSRVLAEQEKEIWVSGSVLVWEKKTWLYVFALCVKYYGVLSDVSLSV